MTFSFTPNDIPNPDEILRLFDLASEQAVAANQDMVLLIEHKGTPIEGESPRKFEDGKKRLSALGCLLISGVKEASPNRTKVIVTTSDLIVVRQCDAATASIANLFKKQEEDLKVQISFFKTDGAGTSEDQQPMLEITIERGRIAYFSMLTSSKFCGAPCEVIAFAHQGLKIDSAPQLKSGLRGALRVCDLGA